jgi:hypothetical protein
MPIASHLIAELVERLPNFSRTTRVGRVDPRYSAIMVGPDFAMRSQRPSHLKYGAWKGRWHIIDARTPLLAYLNC